MLKTKSNAEGIATISESILLCMNLVVLSTSLDCGSVNNGEAQVLYSWKWLWRSIFLGRFRTLVLRKQSKHLNNSPVKGPGFQIRFRTLVPRLLTSEKLPGAWLTDEKLTSGWLTGAWWTYTFDAFSIWVKATLMGLTPGSIALWGGAPINSHQMDLNWQPGFSCCSVSSLSSLIFLQHTFNICVQVSRFLQTKYYM